MADGSLLQANIVFLYFFFSFFFFLRLPLKAIFTFILYLLYGDVLRECVCLVVFLCISMLRRRTDSRRRGRGVFVQFAVGLHFVTLPPRAAMFLCRVSDILFICVCHTALWVCVNFCILGNFRFLCFFASLHLDNHLGRSSGTFCVGVAGGG
ncbi:hypothetical protein TraAM80_01040 [Trypanosoma rangeli]|uniref:Uncharacterized protein n=1 Tax=Trypanosoma rangeli TaxID=5698 RepID=A0A3R7LBV4_TRYRA|nr:uncharacterized protein TraAM80_01040 [Trypanosoma rangeli]RNF11252.1 hypothetical protein TraAM80_01040 [Trypanosoma rangeli]|eukprot:RNF11252.1 hypothetical protein TraAM80_01040 [Trypanosoma rangeli]